MTKATGNALTIVLLVLKLSPKLTEAQNTVHLCFQETHRGIIQQQRGRHWNKIDNIKVNFFLFKVSPPFSYLSLETRNWTTMSLALASS